MHKQATKICLYFLIANFCTSSVCAKIIGLDIGTNQTLLIQNEFWKTIADKTDDLEYQELRNQEIFNQALPERSLKTITITPSQKPFGKELVAKAYKIINDDLILPHKTYSVVTENTDSVKYKFFPGTGRNAKTLIVISPGLSISQSMVAPNIAPYLIILNKHLKYSCLYMPYPGHFKTENTNEKLLRKGFGAGVAESKALVQCITDLKGRAESFEKTIGFGMCFGASVLAITQAISPIFDAFLFISPLLDPIELIKNVLSKEKAFTSIYGQSRENALKRFKGKDIRLASAAFNGFLFLEKYSPFIGTASFGLLKLLLKGQFNRFAIAKFVLLFATKHLIFGSNGITKMAAEKIFNLKLINYQKYYSNISVPTLYINSTFSHKSKETFGDPLTTKEPFERLVKELYRKKRNFTVFWSEDVGHLKNWANEGLELLILSKGFLNNPSTYLAKIKNIFLE